MKILKPGNVEQRKFECRKCECVFVALRDETEFPTLNNEPYVFCPICNEPQPWHDGDPYEEPSRDVQGDALRLYELMKEVWPYSIGALEVLSKFLADNGVIFRKEEK